MSKPHRTCEGYIDTYYYTHKTTWIYNSTGFFKQRVLKRSFPTLGAAQKFSEGKCLHYGDIYRNKGKFVVEYIKIIPLDEY